MPNPIFDGLALLDPVGSAILATNVVCLAGAVAAHVALRARYLAIERDLERSAGAGAAASNALLNRIFRDAEEAARRSGDPNVQAIVEDDFRAGLPGLLLAERFVRAATSLVLVLGLLGTFYGLTLSIGKLVHLVAADTGAVADMTQTLSHGLTDALSGMAVAFSNSLVGIASAVLLTVLGVINNVADRRTGLMIQIEARLDRIVAAGRTERAQSALSAGGFAESVARLDDVVVRFEAALRNLLTSTKDLREVQVVVGLKRGDRN
ncbi:MAG: hypothetical protein ACRENE_33905 [Polyangiaceae bacterium]